MELEFEEGDLPHTPEWAPHFMGIGKLAPDGEKCHIAVAHVIVGDKNFEDVEIRLSRPFRLFVITVLGKRTAGPCHLGRDRLSPLRDGVVCASYSRLSTQ